VPNVTVTRVKPTEVSMPLSIASVFFCAWASSVLGAHVGGGGRDPGPAAA
jgi:hypothetical protein